MFSEKPREIINCYFHLSYKEDENLQFLIIIPFQRRNYHLPLLKRRFIQNNY